MSFDLGLSGRRALVTGGTKGVGAAVVQSLRNAGVKIMTTARTIPDMPQDDVLYVAADVATAEGCQTVADAALMQLGGVDIIVNVVGGSSAPGGGFAALTDNEWQNALNQNLMSAVR
ncbi:MAG TPA: short-chain dehydrogenase, partial [Rhodospirillaceae bacterium]|nr:short-chain dehydrogenase [Rhodospirillaceae bacterium]